MSDTVEEKVAVIPTKMSKGNMPMPLVWYIRFHEDDTIGNIARKYFTTPGKVTDIVKSFGQKYIVQDMVWSFEELAAARETIRDNFVRGQSTEESNRKTATTTAEDSAYSLEVLDKVEQMSLTGVTLSDARSAWSLANPKVDEEGNPIVKAPREPKLDENGEPVKRGRKAKKVVEEASTPGIDLDELLGE
jgi:hypothetical protein